MNDLNSWSLEGEWWQWIEWDGFGEYILHIWGKGKDDEWERKDTALVSSLCSLISDDAVPYMKWSRPVVSDCSLPGFSVHGIFQAIVLEWIAISFSRGSSWPRDRTQVSRILDRRLTVWATREVLYIEHWKFARFGIEG